MRLATDLQVEHLKEVNQVDVNQYILYQKGLREILQTIRCTIMTVVMVVQWSVRSLSERIKGNTANTDKFGPFRTNFISSSALASA